MIESHTNGKSLESRVIESHTNGKSQESRVIESHTNGKSLESLVIERLATVVLEALETAELNIVW